MIALDEKYHLSEKPWDLTPSVSGEYLLLVNGTEQERKHYGEQGFRTYTYVSNPALATSDSIVDMQEIPWNDIGSIYICSASYFSSLDALSSFFEKAKAGAKVYLQWNNADYFQDVINKSTREVSPWPHHKPMGKTYSFDEIKHFCSSINLWNFSIVDDLDSHYANTNSSNWLHIDGLDCKVFLPTDQVKRKEVFQQSIRVTGTKKSHGNWGQNLATSDFDIIADLIAKKDFIQAKTLLENRQEKTWQDFLYLGILLFEENKHLDAYLTFLDAIEMNPEQIETYIHLKVVSSFLGREQDVEHLISVQSQKYPKLLDI